jgi:hypothetical protein
MENNIDEYHHQIEERESFYTDSSNKMELHELVNYLASEDQTLHVHIDPIYLKDGINEIKNVILTTLDDKVIIVPKID